MNGARSPLKLHLIGAMMGWSIVEFTEHYLDDLKARGIPRPKTVLVVGYGSTGSAVVRFFKALGYDVVVKERLDTKLGVENAAQLRKDWGDAVSVIPACSASGSLLSIGRHPNDSTTSAKGANMYRVICFLLEEADSGALPPQAGAEGQLSLGKARPGQNLKTAPLNGRTSPNSDGDSRC